MATPYKIATWAHNLQQPTQETSLLFTINKSESQLAMPDLQRVWTAISSDNPGGQTIASVMISPKRPELGCLTDSFPKYVPGSH